jgi:hypothetical protein
MIFTRSGCETSSKTMPTFRVNKSSISASARIPLLRGDICRWNRNPPYGRRAGQNLGSRKDPGRLLQVSPQDWPGCRPGSPQNLSQTPSPSVPEGGGFRPRLSCGESHALLPGGEYMTKGPIKNRSASVRLAPLPGKRSQKATFSTICYHVSIAKRRTTSANSSVKSKVLSGIDFIRDPSVDRLLCTPIETAKGVILRLTPASSRMRVRS